MQKSDCFSSVKLHNGSYNVSKKAKEQIQRNLNLTTAKENSKNETSETFWKCRYVMVTIALFQFFFLTAYRINLSIGLVAMVNNSAINHQTYVKSESCAFLITNTTGNETQRVDKEEGEFVWSPQIQGYIQSSFFFCYLFTQIPTGRLAERIGFKWPMFVSSLVIAISNLLIPASAWLSSNALIVVQSLRGFAQGMIQPSLSVLVVNWYPKVERGPMYAISKSGSPLGNLVASIVSGLLCDSSLGWPASFYVLGAAGVLLSLAVLFFAFDNPKVHPRISSSEANFIMDNQECDFSKTRPKPPWKKILTSVPVYALSFAYFGQQWIATHFRVAHSTFLSTILHYPILQNGLLTAAPYILQFSVSESAAWLSLYLQKKNIVNIDFLRKFWTFLGSLGYSVCILGMYLVECNRSLSVAFSILALGISGFAFAGCWITSADMAPMFSGSVHAFCCTLGFLSSIIGPLVVGYLTDESQTIEQWNKFFLLSIGVVMASAVIFCIFGSANAQPWNFVNDDISDKGEKNMEKYKKGTENDVSDPKLRY